METKKKQRIIDFIKKRKDMIAIALLIVGMVTPVIVSAVKVETLKNQLETYLSEEYGLTEIKISTEKDSYLGYNAYVTCIGLDSFSYEEMTQIAYYYNIDGINIASIKCNGDAYRIYETSVYKNEKKVYEKNSLSSYIPSHSSLSSDSAHTCEECDLDAVFSFTSPFTGQQEWYCLKHYRELQDMLDQFGMD